MLRGSEALGLTWGAVVLLPEGLQLFIPFSKTDPRGDGAFILLGRLPGCTLDPAAFFDAWQEAAGGGASDAALFPVWAGGRPAAKDTMLGRMRRLLQRMGMSAADAQLYGLHSLRRGGATAASRAGAPLRLIKEHGRWRSDTVREYTYADDAEQGQ